MAILSGPILVALAVTWPGRYMSWAMLAPWLDVLERRAAATANPVLRATIALCGFLVLLCVQGPWVG
ncbi:uncharacterized protein [Physcomitrium patens]|uniref:uncharacterized protein isoform X3 n=1 Tax=Physcomitrium patens TaxID=3218 RepID=UPI00024AC32F